MNLDGFKRLLGQAGQAVGKAVNEFVPQEVQHEDGSYIDRRPRY